MAPINHYNDTTGFLMFNYNLYIPVRIQENGEKEEYTLFTWDTGEVVTFSTYQGVKDFLESGEQEPTITRAK